MTRGTAGDLPGEPDAARWATRRDGSACCPSASPYRPRGPAPRKGRAEVRTGLGGDHRVLLWKERPLILVRGELQDQRESHQRPGPEVNHFDNRKGRRPAWLPSRRVSVTGSRPRPRITCSESPPLRALPGKREGNRAFNQKRRMSLCSPPPPDCSKFGRAKPAPGSLTTPASQLPATYPGRSPSAKRRWWAGGRQGGSRNGINCLILLLPWGPDLAPD